MNVTDRGSILRGIGAVLVGIAALLFVIWLMLADVHAKGFDADGVRCYSRASQVVCIKTANP